MTKEEFKKFAKKEFGYDISFEKSDEPDTFESLFGSCNGCKGCEHAPTTYEEYCLHTCCPDAYTDKAAGCELFKKQRAIEESYQKGLNDAWECAEKIVCLSKEEYKDAFNEEWSLFKLQDRFYYDSALDAIQEMKKYEEKKQKHCRDCEYYDYPNRLECKRRRCVYHSDWTPKQTEKSCETCKHNDIASGIDGTCYECLKGIQNHYEKQSRRRKA